MRPVLIQRLEEAGLPTWIVPDFFGMLTIAVFACCIVTLFLWHRRGQRNRTAADLLFWGLLAMIPGARLFYLLQYGWPDSPSKLWTGSGIALYGGLFGILSAWGIYYVVRAYPAGTFLDCVAPGLALGLFFGRLGCLFAGCNGGTVCSLPWSVRFPADTPVFVGQASSGLVESGEMLSLPVHPTQLYEALFGLAVFAGLVKMFDARRWEGELFVIGILWYSVYRFVSEWLRADAGGVNLLGVVTFSQALSILFATGAIAALKFRLKKTGFRPNP